MKLKLTFFILFISILNLRAQTPSIVLEDFASGFSQPVEIANAGDSKLYIVERAGKTKVQGGFGQADEHEAGHEGLWKHESC